MNRYTCAAVSGLMLFVSAAYGQARDGAAATPPRPTGPSTQAAQPRPTGPAPTAPAPSPSAPRPGPPTQTGPAPAQSAPAQAGAREPAPQSAPGYEVQPGDLLQVSVWKEQDLDRQVLVRPDGGFSFPLAGDVNAIGKTVDQLRGELTERLARFIPDLFVTVAVLEINGNKVYVIGQVNNAGQFVVNPRVDVIQALSLAGGTTAFASPNDIFVLRREGNAQRRLPFNFGEVARGKNLEQNIILRSGDVVVVP
jgi:polysaccharide export outer membrane protein